jgi:hypothetical protein
MADQHQPPTGQSQSMPDKPARDQGKSSAGDGVQGEGNYDAARRYRQEVDDFVKKADIDKAAHDAAPKTEREADEMASAEEQGRSRRRT